MWFNGEIWAVRLGVSSDSGSDGDDDGNAGPVQFIPESVIEELLRRSEQRQANSRNNDQIGVGSERRHEDQPREREGEDQPREPQCLGLT